MDAFRDPLSRQDRLENPVGRSWTVQELRRKSFDDLHKLWLVLYKERNMVQTELVLCRRNQVTLPQPNRLRKIQKSMGAIRHVLGERKRERIASKLASLKERDDANPEIVFDGEDDHASSITDYDEADDDAFHL